MVAVGHSERELVARARRGDARAFEALVVAHQDAVFQLCARHAGPREAEELAQETFLRAFVHVTKLDPDQGVRSWLLSVAHRICIDRYRTRREFASLDEAAHAPAPAPEPEGVLDAAAVRVTDSACEARVPGEDPRSFLAGDFRMRLATLVAAVFLQGCVGYVLSVAPGPAKAIPETLHGLAPGPITSRALTQAGWALADEKAGVRTYVLAVSDPGEREVEAEVVVDGEALRVRRVRQLYKAPRLTTYRTLVNALVAAHGPPQESVEVPESPLLSIGDASPDVRPTRVIVHRWKGAAAELVLVGGLEAEENLRTAMEYQLLLVAP